MFNHSNSSRTSVSGGTFSVVHGNQLNYYTGAPRDRRRFLPGEEWKEEIYREYERMPRGQIKLINTISEVKVTERESYEDSGCLTKGSEASERTKRVFHLAQCTVNAARESPPFLVVKYTGRDAKSAFKRDVLQFSQLQDPVFPQLRGFNDSEIPMVIFHDLLIPAMHAIEHAQNSPAMVCYLRLQGETAVSNLPPTAARIMLSRSENFPHSEHIWIRPQTGDVCLGPAGPWLPLDCYFTMNIYPVSPHMRGSPLSLGAYNNSALFDHLLQNATSGFVLSALSQQHTWPYPDGIDYYRHILHVYSRFDQRPVAKFPENTWNLTLHCISLQLHHLEKPAEILMEDGRTRCISYSAFPTGSLNLWLALRFTILNHNIEHQSLSFRFDQDWPSCSYYEAWLCQAIHVFHALGIPREEWENFTLLSHYFYTFSLGPVGHDQSRQNYDSYRFDPPYYLFVLPPPQLPDTTPDVVSWMQAPAESLYYWSVDPDGNSRMPEAHRTALGLPCFQNYADPPHGWKVEIYDLVRQWQEAKGFDPTTTDFARSLGYPIIEILPQDNDRFETFVENGESSGPKREQEPELMQVDEAFKTMPRSQVPLFQPHDLEGSASMNVDMEECSSRMAGLRVEAMLVDE
ncbi:hypothetical protein PQX77_009281 [Marasmius sp. AFHP31]|nr:hypothetical protein PQX77_009281 [Marasmius sp. AFHP31]